jgi:hypothetical protein
MKNHSNLQEEKKSMSTKALEPSEQQCVYKDFLRKSLLDGMK